VQIGVMSDVHGNRHALEAVLADAAEHGVLGVHASPGEDDGDGITPLRTDDELRRDLAGSEADIVFAGHTHQPTDRPVAGVRAVNRPGAPEPTT
jgi:predicted phosphodiesterase